ncbi:uncharacterized protein STEHIDRAFT_162007 [Stereum hirsutum FP-91666 SS1]|uniref:uncharacterized protein n=1 Tax=Stereum hirsutum (strain FP-91666) TaxID=721885 RepID=UPI000444A416|nr:uncharacterized protein STEHIDRAFT_162007 [Stereum hirsutum FP-91666 SS1]EIM81001.1 hypothetical protein STEHIDRAFT_162007 [Stereum hirsutum FP-91666 SS1]
MPHSSILHKVIVAETIWLISDYATVAAFTLWALDYLQTFATEIVVLWAGNIRSATSILFIINRYGFLASQMIQLYVGTPGTASDSSCRIALEISDALTILTVASTSSLLALRVYSIYSRSRYVLALTAALILTRSALDIYLAAIEIPFSTKGSILTGISRCGFVYPTAAVNGGLFVVAAANGSLLIAGVVDLNFAGSPSITILSPFFSVVPNILVHRLFLNLRSFRNPGYGLSSSDTPLPVPSFAQNRPNRFLGNIGEPIDYDQWNDDFEDAELDGGAVRNDTNISRVRDPLTTLVPVVYEGAGTEPIEMMAMQREPITIANPSCALEVA